MKKRIKDTPVSSNEFCGEFYDNYHKPIDWFFGERKEETVYIKDVETVNKIESILFNESSNIIYLIGKAGIGKTTLIRNEFGVSDNQVFLDENRKNIFVSLGFRGQLVENDISGFMANSISAICEFLEDKLDIGESFYSEKGHLEFYDFIKQTMPAILGNVKTTELIGKNNIEAKLFRLEKAQEYNLYSYEASRLKYYLLKYCRNYKKLVIMVDNTEGFSDEIQKLIIRNMLSFFSCLLNVAEKDKNEMLSINLIVSMRDTSFVKIKKVKEIMAYSPAVVIAQNNPVNIISYLERKYREVRCSEDEREKIWKEMYELIRDFNLKFDSKYLEMIKNLSNYDFQVVKLVYKKILTNKLWLLRGNRKREFQNMSNMESLFNNISVIRAMACGNNAVYRGAKSKVVPNIFLNDEVHDDSLVALLTLSYFINNEFYIKMGKLQLIFKEIFWKKTIDEALERVIKHFLECDVLEEAVNTQLEDTGRYLIITPRGKELWDMFTADSVLLEMYREDHFLQSNIADMNFVSSYNLMEEVGQFSVFNQLFYFIDFLLDMERELHRIAVTNNKLNEYYNCFGRKLQTKRLLDGVIKSVEYSGNFGVDKIPETIEKLKEKMKNIDYI